MDVRLLHFAIRPYDFVADKCFAENDLEHTICVALEVFLSRQFTNRTAPRETTASYTVSIAGEHFPTRSNRQNARFSFHRTICHTRVLRFAGTMKLQL